MKLSERYFNKMKQYAEKVNAPIFSQESIITYGDICRLEGLISGSEAVHDLSDDYAMQLRDIEKENNL